MKKIKEKNKRRILIPVLVLTVIILSILVYKGIGNVIAAERTWAQTDWRGDTSPSVITENTNTFLEEENINYSNEGSIAVSKLEGWDLTDWNYRRKIIFDNTFENLGVTPENLVDFPIMVQLEDGVNIDYSQTKDDGSDIRFVDTDGTELSYEIETWDESGVSVVWVKVPQIDTGSEDYINMYYGNDLAVNTENSANVWDDNYLGVWHMDEQSGTSYDSTSNTVDLTPRNSVSSDESGIINGGDGFMGNGDALHNTTETVAFGKYITLEGWMYRVGSGSGSGRILEFSPTGNADSHALAVDSDGSLRAWVECSNGSRVGSVDDTTAYNGNQWIYYSYTYDGTTARIYVNGLQTRAVNSSCSDLADTQDTIIGAISDGSGQYDLDDHEFDGYLDEHRVSDVVRSAAWNSAVYNSVASDFTSYEIEEFVYMDSAYLVSNVFDTGYPSDWANLTYITSVTDSLEVKVRTSSLATMSGATAWGSCNVIISDTDISSNNCVNDTDQYIQYRIEIDMDGQSVSPEFENIEIDFSASDQTKPTVNASDVILTGGRENGDWLKYEPTMIWSPGIDDVVENEVFYCISLNEVGMEEGSQLLDPELTSGVIPEDDNDSCPYRVTGTTVDLSSIDGLNLVSNMRYYFSIKAVDISGNVWSGNSEDYQDLVWFKYDDTIPNNVMYISTPSTDFGNINDMFFNWPITGSPRATDQESELLGWQYAINSSLQEDWKGTELHPKLGISYIPLEGITEGIVNLSTDEDGDDIIIGNNTIYFRSIDNAGNVSTYVTGGINYGGAAPEFPAESIVTINPESSISNEFSISWPAAIPGDGDEISSYYYMINTEPPSSLSTLRNNNHVYIPTTDLSVPTAKLIGAVKGTNNVYVVSVDNQDNYSPTKAIHGTFDLNSTLPDAPVNLSAADLSVRDNELWRVALSWNEPAYKGNGDMTYIIERSSNGSTWGEVSRTAGLSYTDIVPESKTYYYKVATIDTSNESIINPTYSNFVEILPKGRYEDAPALISNPVISNVTTRNAKISWVTDRGCDSKVQLGISSGEYFQDEMYRSEIVTAHEIELTNLSPGTQYYYRTKWTDQDGNTGVSKESVFQTKPAPRIEDVEVSSIGLDYVIIDVLTKGSVSANFLYGRTKNYGGSKEINTSTSESEYSVMLTALEDGVEYHYTIILTDEEGFEYDGFGDLVFTTPPRPQVSNIQIQEKKGVPTPTVDVFWESNIEVSSIVKYSSAGKSLDKVDMDMIKGEHSMELSGLEPDSNYQLVVEGVDAMGNRAVSDVYTFTTATDTRPPQVFSIKSEGDVQSSDVQADRTRSAQLVISWETDEPSTSQVLYGEGAGGDGYPFSTQTDSEMRYKHVIVVSNLAPSKVYHFKVISKDIAGNVGESGSVTAITPKSTDTVIESVLGSLSRIFGFL
jgi:hypothetical protein